MEVCSTEYRLLEGKPFGAFAPPAKLSRLAVPTKLVFYMVMQNQKNLTRL